MYKRKYQYKLLSVESIVFKDTCVTSYERCILERLFSSFALSKARHD